MPGKILDNNLIHKLVLKLRLKENNKKLNEKNIQDRVYRLNQKLGVHSEAALVILAKQNKISTGNYEKKLSAEVRSEIRQNLANKEVRKQIQTYPERTEPKRNQVDISDRILIKASIDYLFKDTELKDRCSDLLTAKNNFDRAINQATLILEDRIRKKAPPPTRMVGVALSNYAFNPDLNRTILKVSDNADEQDGFCNIIRGIMLAFRNITHHHVVNKFSREYALSVCAFIDVLLQVVNESNKIR